MLQIPTDHISKQFAKDHPKFAKMVDELIEYANIKDYELLTNLEWVTEEAKKKNMSFYQMVYVVLSKHDEKKRIREWVSQIQTIKENRKKTNCTNCGTDKIKGSNFCHKCGVTLA